MNFTKLLIVGCICATTIRLAARDGDDRPILKEPPERLVDAIQNLSKEISSAARFNVADDVAHKRIRIIAMNPMLAVDVKEYGFNLDVFYRSFGAPTDLGTGSYRFQQNAVVLSFAATQFASGNKALGIRLTELLSKAEPDLFWSTPTHPSMKIQKILIALQNNDKNINDFLNDEKENWAEASDLAK